MSDLSHLPVPYSIIIEMENAETIEWHEVADMFQALVSQIRENPRDPRSPLPEIVCIHEGEDTDSHLLYEKVTQEVPELTELAKLICLGLPDARYYELKNNGALKSTGDVIIFLDSDSVPQPGWLEAMLKPFADPQTVVAGGITCLGYDSLVSRTLALTWIFPLIHGNDPEVARRPVYANNAAFRGTWFRENPFPSHDGFKVSCTLHCRLLKEQGHAMVPVDAITVHAPLRGFRFLVWRAWVTGRDADRKVVAIKGYAWPRRLLRAIKHGLQTQKRCVLRIVCRSHYVDMPWYQVPVALVMAITFYAIMFFAQVAEVFGMLPGGPEHIPHFVENS
ncbi:glycosyltransferase family 2 protein [Bremerella sp.]|uniref:glycosyltransferase family 2 protein n=1 Tax=Bremerella sp. TaxID=2795602 RepID=UPI00391AC1E8